MNINEQKLTAYALGELSDSERAAIEQELERNPEAQKTVEEIRNLGTSLDEHFSKEEPVSLSFEQRLSIFKKIKSRKEVAPSPVPKRYTWFSFAGASAIAAIFVAFCGCFVIVQMIEKQEKAFCPSLPVVRQKMYLKKPSVTVSKAASSSRQTTSHGRTEGTLVLAEIQDTGSAPAANGIVLPEVSAFEGKMSGRIGFCMPDVAECKLSRQQVAVSQYGPSIEDYAEIQENSFKRVSEEPLSTFSIDVDTASYSNVRRFLKDGMLPPKDAVRIEELINYFSYNYAPPTDGTPFKANFAQSVCPWNPQHKLIRIGLKGRVIEQTSRPPLNLVFLLDVSGSMNSPNKLPLVKQSMEILTRQLSANDRVAIVVYAGASGLVLPPTSGADRQTILDALKRLKAGGGTNGGQGIQLAYSTAQQYFQDKGVNRVILCTDGDFNIGVTQGGDLNRLIEEKAKSEIFLSVLGFGMDNYKDGTLEQLADRGNGNYAYIDTFSEARKVLADQMTGTLVTIAKDVKIQVEFNPANVAGYRLIGYENRMLAAEDFNDDKKDAGEIGAGHTVTALYEIIPTGLPVDDRPPVDDLKYQKVKTKPVSSGELLTVKLRYKEPDSDTSSKLEFPLRNEDRNFEQTDDDFRFAAAVAGFGMILRDSEFKGNITYDKVIGWATLAKGNDTLGYRTEFIELARNAQALSK